ncbi:hypothetical protein B296_00034622 [Ensete ventricosum]|uniref:AT-hook motif nuclear-localized protein n=1 Tax=Ensete ventricosum TaxID=4639 RepID=A0A426Y1E5_ENSVE|nr:hypothetical protein B296_00034622 [Ensete ventricosum]
MMRLSKPKNHLFCGSVSICVSAAFHQSSVLVVAVNLEFKKRVQDHSVVVGSFLPSYKMQQKIKRPRLETGSASTPTSAIQRSNATMEEALASGQDQQISATVNPNPLTASPFSGENWSASLQPAPGATNTTDINTSLPGG